MATERFQSIFARDERRICLHFAVKDERGAIHFHVDVEDEPDEFYRSRFSCAGVETHYAEKPDYMGEAWGGHQDCWILGKECWHDGTSLWAEEHWVPGFKNFGTEWVWSELERHHAKVFEAPTQEGR